MLELACQGRGTTIANIIFKKENEIGRAILPDFKTYYKATVIVTICSTGIKIDIKINGTEQSMKRPTHIAN